MNHARRSDRNVIVRVVELIVVLCRGLGEMKNECESGSIGMSETKMRMRIIGCL